jgi:hypothetical protein
MEEIPKAFRKSMELIGFVITATPSPLKVHLTRPENPGSRRYARTVVCHSVL